MAALGIAYSVLSDAKRRATYDSTGTIMTEEEQSSYDLWRTVFPKLTKQDVDEFTQKYRFGEEERADVLKEYNAHAGDIKQVLERVMCCEDEDEERFVAMVFEAIEAGQVEALPAFTATYGTDAAKAAAKIRRRLKASATRRRKAAEREAREAEELAAELGYSTAKGGSPAAGANGAAGGAGDGDLASIILSRQRQRMNALDALEAKYAGGGSGGGKSRGAGPPRGSPAAGSKRKRSDGKKGGARRARHAA